MRMHFDCCRSSAESQQASSMAHLGSAYCQTVSARIKTQEAMASFPLSKRPFARLELSERERRRFHTQATELLGHALQEYEEFALIRHRQVDRRRWKPLKSHEKLAVYRESRSYAISRSLSVEDEETFARAAVLGPVSVSEPRRGSRSSSSSGGSRSGSIYELPAHQATELELLTGWGPTATQKKRAKSVSVGNGGGLVEQLPTLLGVGNIIGSLDDVMYGVAAPDCASMALKNGYQHEDAMDGDVLCAIEGPSQRSPFRFLGIKWLVKSTAAGGVTHRLASPRDLVFLEATGVITRGDGVRIGYQIMHSVKLRGCPELYDSHGVVRARCESVHLFVELNSKTVDVFLKSNVTPSGKISESAALHNCANNLLYCGKTVQCSHDKKLAWRLQTRGDNQHDSNNENKAKATQCGVCSKSFGFLRHSVECKLCSSAVCSKCSVERTLKHVDTSGSKRHTSKFVSSSIIELCTSCVATNMQTNALVVAREEVMAGRFGRVAKGSQLPPSQHRGSGNSSEYSSSIATITIEDIPGQPEHNGRPPRQSDVSSRKNQRSHQKEDVRSHRDRDLETDRGYPAGPERVAKRGHAYRQSPPTNSRKHSHVELPKVRTRSGSHEPVHPKAPQPIFRRGDSDEMHRENWGENYFEVGRYNERYSPRDPILLDRHHPMNGHSPVELDNSGRGLPVDLCDLEDASPYTSSKESIRKTTSSSGSSLEDAHTAGISPLRMAGHESDSEEEDDDTESPDTFDSFGDLIEIRSEYDDVDETLDTKDMEAVKRASQVNRKLWQQIADLRDAAENVYLYTKESTAMHMTQGGSVRRRPSNPVRPGRSLRLAAAQVTHQLQSMSDDGTSGDGDSRLDLFLAAVEKFSIELDDPVETAEEFEELEELDLSEKGLAELPSDLVLALPPNLKTLALEKNGLTQLPESFGNDAASSAAWGQLTELYVRNNELTKLPAGISELSKLESLYLEDNKLTSDGIPDEVAQLSDTLAGLCLHRNLLTVGHAEFIIFCGTLEELYLDDNALEYLPEEFGMLQNLKELDIIGNKLTTLPSSFKNLHCLEILHAERNQLVKLPKHLGELQSLRKVYLQNNCLTKLHASLGRCMKLEVLNLEDNNLAKVAKRIGDLPKLKHLLLANNNITELPFNPVEKNPNLRRLTLSGNQLSPETLELEKQVAMAKVVEEDESED
ncbi:unnamed protein product [Phytophthora fragariaefolia]|uniref:Unnamed protein product n=1 Tax=Phytophthora fragariaefolia TaxID=1490495 RepID=A0A9W7CW08_9STRA|nr:unnamed protein product [Phytophthora fragariaefolia]